MLVHLTIKGECDDLKCFEGGKRVRKIEKMHWKPQIRYNAFLYYISGIDGYRKIINEDDVAEGKNIGK